MTKEKNWKKLRRLITTQSFDASRGTFSEEKYYDLPIETKQALFFEDFDKTKVFKKFGEVKFLSNQGFSHISNQASSVLDRPITNEQLQAAGFSNLLGSTVVVSLSIYYYQGHTANGDLILQPLLENFESRYTGLPNESDATIVNKARGICESQALTSLGYRLPAEYTQFDEESELLSNTAPVETKPKGKRGRPRKNKQEEISIQNPFDTPLDDEKKELTSVSNLEESSYSHSERVESNEMNKDIVEEVNAIQSEQLELDMMDATTLDDYQWVGETRLILGSEDKGLIKELVQSETGTEIILRAVRNFEDAGAEVEDYMPHHQPSIRVLKAISENPNILLSIRQAN